MNPVELSRFWDYFSDKAVKAGVAYSSESNMESVVSNWFMEDFENLVEM
jgi:hypothetical protein